MKIPVVRYQVYTASYSDPEELAQVDITPEMTVAEIRAEIMNRLQVSAADKATVSIALYHWGMVPEDVKPLELGEYRKTATEIGLRDDYSVLALIQPTVVVRTLNGKSFFVQNLASTTLAQLTVDVQDAGKCDIPAGKQVLIFNQTIIKPELHRLTLSDYGMKADDVLYVAKNAWEVSVCHPSANWSVKVGVTPLTTMEDIKAQVQQTHDIVIRTSLYQYGREIPDATPLKDCESALSNSKYRFSYSRSSKDITTIFIHTLTGKRIPIKIHLTDALQYLKKCIQDKEGIPTDQQRLIFDGQLLAPEHKMLAAFGLVPNCNVELFLLLRGCACGCLEYDRRSPEDITTLYGNVKVALPDGRCVTLDVEPVQHTIKDLKQMVHDAAEPPFDVNRVGLLFCGKLLGNEMTLQQACIRNRSELKLVQLLGPSYGLGSTMSEEDSVLALYDIYGHDMMRLIRP